MEEDGPAHSAGLRVGDLITHINAELVQGLVHTDVLEIMYKSKEKVKQFLKFLLKICWQMAMLFQAFSLEIQQISMFECFNMKHYSPQRNLGLIFYYQLECEL